MLRQRTPLKRTRLLRKSKLKPMSKRRQGEARIYSEKRKAFLADHRWCQAFKIILERAPRPLPDDLPLCWPYSVEIHHTKKPKCKYLNDESTWLAVSRWSHEWIENHKSIARELGLLV